MLKYESVKNTFEKNGFSFEICETIDVAKDEILKDIDLFDKVDFGGSVSLDEVGLYDDLKQRKQDVFWHWKDTEKTRNGNLYLTSSNAITEDGKLVNMDGVGNRVSSMIYGYERVYIVVGKNKLVKDYDEAIDRIRTIAGPKNAERLKLETPCVKTGKCEDCNSPQRICMAETIIHKNPNKAQIKIYFIEENLGY